MTLFDYRQIPQKFLYENLAAADGKTEASTIAELKSLLRELPDSLPVHCGLGGFVTLVVEGGYRDAALNFLNCD